MLTKFLAALFCICTVPLPATATSVVTTRIVSGSGSVTPGKAVIPTGGNLNFILATANGIISYVTLDGKVVTVFRFGGIGRSSAIINITDNGRPQRLYVYFSSRAGAQSAHPGTEPIAE